MSTNSIDVIGTTYEPEVSEDDLEALDQGDSVANYEAVVATSEGLYSAPANASEAAIAEVLGEEADDVYKRVVSYDEDARTSATARRASEDHFGEITRMAGSPQDILNGKVMDREGQSTETVTEYEPIDRID